MLNDAKVQECMTYPAISASPTTSLRAAKQLMKEFNIRHLPIVKGEQLIGVLSSGDIRRASPSDATSLSIWELNYLWEQLTAESAMSTHVLTVTPDMLVIDAVRLMFEHRFGCVPVVDTGGRLQGILTEIDVFRWLISLSEEAPYPVTNLSCKSWAATSL